MTVTVTVRDVPEDVREALAGAARTRGQSLQAFLLGVLNQQAAFANNAQLLTNVANDLAVTGGAQADAPDAATLLEQARAQRRGTKDHRGARPAV
jgi:antitoxin FitA